MIGGNKTPVKILVYKLKYTFKSEVLATNGPQVLKVEVLIMQSVLLDIIYFIGLYWIVIIVKVAVVWIRVNFQLISHQSVKLYWGYKTPFKQTSAPRSGLQAIEKTKDCKNSKMLIKKTNKMEWNNYKNDNKICIRTRVK